MATHRGEESRCSARFFAASILAVFFQNWQKNWACRDRSVYRADGAYALFLPQVQPMKPLSKLFSRFLASVWPQFRFRLIEQVGGEVARECRASLWQTVRHQVARMSIPEARGYIRAQAAWIADRMVGPSLDHYALKADLRAEVLASGVDQLVAMVVRDAIGEAVAPARKRMAA